MIKNLPVRHPGLIPGLGRSPGEGNANPHQYSCLENSMDRGTWWATFHGVAKSQMQLTTDTHKTMASRPITSWQTKGKGRSSNRFPLPGLSDHCRWWLSYEIRRWLLLGRKSMTNVDSVLKSKDITLLTKVCIVKVMVFPVVMCRCKN